MNSRILVVNLTYKWAGHPAIKRNTVQLVHNAVANSVFAIGNGGFVNATAYDTMSYDEWLNHFPAVVPAAERDEIPAEELPGIYDAAKKRFKKLRDLKIGDVLIINVPGHGIIGVGVVSQTYHEGPKLADSDPFTRQVNLVWLVEPRPETDGYRSLIKVNQVLVQPTTSTINDPGQVNARRLLRVLLEL